MNRNEAIDKQVEDGSMSAGRAKELKSEPEFNADYKYTYTTLREIVRELTQRVWTDKHQQFLTNTLVFRDLANMAKREEFDRLSAIANAAIPQEGQVMLCCNNCGGELDPDNVYCDPCREEQEKL